ncbi:hypothetical protein UNPF46_32175 [Bradyrhizobium sp. UNPF46]|nr:hypothetical protein UNPF46_32175 [Bradyrhizobium sp. UNPF46]
MIDPSPKLAKLRAPYPDDIKRIEEDEKRIVDLLRMHEFSQQPVVGVTELSQSLVCDYCPASNYH